MKTCVIVLAAGEGTRMKSKTTKVLHKVCGVPMISYVLDSALSVAEKVVVILGKNRAQVEPFIPDGVAIAEQEEPLGTGHAVLSAERYAAGSENVLVLSGDTPLLTANTLKKLVDAYESSGSSAVVLTALYDDPFGYGRIVRDKGELLKAIVEEQDANEEQKKIKEVNTGTYIFRTEDLFSALKEVENKNVKNEYYLTDCIGILSESGKTVSIQRCEDPDETIGINSRSQLAQAEMVVRNRIRERWLKDGVTMVDPSSVFIDRDVVLSEDVIMMPSTFICGNSKIGRDSVIGPFTMVVDSKIGKRAAISYSVLREVEVDDDVTIGPFSSLRSGTHLKDLSKAGTFVEIKKSEIGKGSKVPHLSYIGDAEIGESANVGAGSITCNFDGVAKHETKIADGAFIGSDTMFVAPVKIGKDSVTGAGSVITEDVPDGALGISRARQEIIEGYASGKKK